MGKLNYLNIGCGHKTDNDIPKRTEYESNVKDGMDYALSSLFIKAGKELIKYGIIY
jgi:hypothetical protein